MLERSPKTICTEANPMAIAIPEAASRAPITAHPIKIQSGTIGIKAWP